MTAEPPQDSPDAVEGFDAAQQQLMVEIGQHLIALATSGTVALQLSVAQDSADQDVGLDIQLALERQSGLTVPASADDALVDAVQRLVLLWQRYEREPWRTFTYRLTRGPAGPQFTSEFSF
jgi:hypothetical protein